METLTGQDPPHSLGEWTCAYRIALGVGADEVSTDWPCHQESAGETNCDLRRAPMSWPDLHERDLARDGWAL